MKPHKHAELIKAWADGAEIQRKVHGEWEDCQPKWDEYADYRIKPEPKPDVVKYVKTEAIKDGICRWDSTDLVYANLKLIWDGETGKLKDAKVLK